MQNLQALSLQCVQRNYRTLRQDGGEIDLIVQEFDETLLSQAEGSSATPGMQGQRPVWSKSRHDESCLQFGMTG
jgi:hypothetical protein